MTEQEKRHYGITDADMLELSVTERVFYTEDIMSFNNYNPKFDDDYNTEWADRITTAEDAPSDEQIDDILQQKTAAVEQAMLACRNKFQDSKTFIEDAFPDNQMVWNEFGYDDYNAASKSQSNFIQFMNRFHSVAEKYKVALIANNYTQVKIDEIETLGEALKDANTEQEVYKGNIPVITQNRIIAMNACYELTSEVGRVGKLIFRNDYAKYQRYLLTPSNESPEVFSIMGTVTDAATGAALPDVAVSIESLGINTNTDSEGMYGFGALENGTYDVKFEKVGYQPITLSVEVTDEGPTTADAALLAV